MNIAGVKSVKRTSGWGRLKKRDADKKQAPVKKEAQASQNERVGVGWFETDPETNDAILAMLRREREELIASAKRAGLIK